MSHWPVRLTQKIDGTGNAWLCGADLGGAHGELLPGDCWNLYDPILYINDENPLTLYINNISYLSYLLNRSIYWICYCAYVEKHFFQNMEECFFSNDNSWWVMDNCQYGCHKKLTLRTALIDDWKIILSSHK